MSSSTPPGGPESSTGELISRLSDQSSQLVRDEIRLAQAETSAKIKHGVLGIAGFGAAGLLGLYGIGLLLIAAVFGLAEAVPSWAAALIVGALVLAGAVVAGLLGKGQVGEVAPVAPERAVEGLKQDVATMKGDHHVEQ